MEKYSSYKDSGVKWLGEIPSHWEVVSIKKISNIILGKMLENAPDDQGFPYLCAKDVHFEGVSYDDLKKMLFSENEKKKYIVKKGDLLVVEGGAGGTCAIIDKDIDDVYIQNSLMIVRGFPNKVSNNYIFYALSSLVKRGYADSVCNKATILHFTKEKLESTNIALAPLCEQIKIINYLDTVTSQIDTAIAQQQKKMIELLNERKQIIINNAVTKGLDPNVKMKDSGVDWIGEIPEHWEVMQYRYLFYNLDKLRMPITADKRSRNNPQYDYYGASGVIDKIDFYNVDDKVLLIGEDGANLLMRNLPLIYKAEGKFWVNNHAHILKPIRDDYDFMAYVMEAADYTLYITGSAQPKLSQANLNCVKLPIPPLEEQKSIVDYLSKRTRKIDVAIEDANKMITLLQERKQIIINEVVTGKVKVE